MDTAPQIPLPKPDELNLEFYKATAAAHQLCMQHCTQCGTWTHPPRYFCPGCTSPNFSFDKVSGRATVYSYTVSRYSVDPLWKPLLPYVTIVAELEEGPRIVALARSIPPENVKIGMPVRVSTENRSEEFVLFWAEQSKEPK
jgi:uncharacterized protein